MENESNPERLLAVSPNGTQGNRQEYILDNILEKVTFIRKRLDRLIFILLLVSIFGVANFTPYEGISIPGFGPISKALLHMFVAFTLIGLFSIIGVHLIDYVRKRFLLDKYAETYLKGEVDDSGERSSVLVSVSPYELVYQLGTSSTLRWPGSVIILLIFYFSHFVAIAHLVKCIEHYNSTLVYSLIVSFIIFYTILYIIFVNTISNLQSKEKIKSTLQSEEKLRKYMKRIILSLLLLSVMILVFLFVIMGLTI